MNNFNMRFKDQELEELEFLYRTAEQTYNQQIYKYKADLVSKLLNGRLFDHLINVITLDVKNVGTKREEQSQDEFRWTCEVLDLIGIDYKETLELLKITIKKAIEITK